MKISFRPFAGITLGLGILLGAVSAAGAAKPPPAPSPSASATSDASPAPLPTATPEPPNIAIPRLEAKIKADPNDKDSLQQLAGYYLGANMNEQALSLTQRLLSLGVKTAQIYYLDGVANQSLGRIREATQDFEAATTQEPTNAQILLTLTNLYLQTNRAADAERVAKRATTFNPTDKRVFENYGLVLGQEGKFDDARAQFEIAAKLDPKDTTPIILEARSYVSQKAIALAQQEFDRALTIDPKSADALLGKALLLASNHDVKDSIATFETLLGDETEDDAKASVLVQEYEVYRDEKMMDQALATLKRAETAYPNSPSVHLAYGDYDVSIAKDTAAAEAEWKQALGPARDNPQALERLGQLALSQNKPKDALDYFKRLNDVVPNDPSVLLHLAQVQAVNGQYSDARGSYVRSYDVQPSPASLAGLGAADLQLRNYSECSKVFAAIDKRVPDFLKANPQLFYVYAKCAIGMNDKSTGLNALTRFKPYVKPGSALANDVNGLIASLSKPAPKPSAKAAPKASAKPSPKPSAHP